MTLATVSCVVRWVAGFAPACCASRTAGSKLKTYMMSTVSPGTGMPPTAKLSGTVMVMTR